MRRGSTGRTVLEGIGKPGRAVPRPVVDRGYVLERGKIVLEDKGINLLNNKMVQEAYVGAT